MIESKNFRNSPLVAQGHHLTNLPRSRFLDVTEERCVTSKKRLRGRLSADLSYAKIIGYNLYVSKNARVLN